MEKCVKHHWFTRYIFPLAVLLLALGCFSLGLYLIGDYFLTGVSWQAALFQTLIPFSVSVFCGYFSISIYCFEMREYAISERGLKLSDNKHIYTWDEIQGIYIVAYGASATMEWYDLVICCFLKKPDRNFRYKILRSPMYPIRHRKSFVTFDYTEELHKKLLMFYQKEIPDLRSLQSAELKHAKRRNK